MTDKIKEMIESGRAPGVAGVSSGPGSCSKEMVFSRPDAAKEFAITMRKMEDNGYFRDKPLVAAKAKKILQSKLSKPQTSVDYDKIGHACDGI